MIETEPCGYSSLVTVSSPVSCTVVLVKVVSLTLVFASCLGYCYVQEVARNPRAGAKVRVSIGGRTNRIYIIYFVVNIH